MEPVLAERMGVLFGIDTLEQQRQRFVDKLRALTP
jgi:hypothetical protein